MTFIKALKIGLSHTEKTERKEKTCQFRIWMEHFLSLVKAVNNQLTVLWKIIGGVKNEIQR